MPAGFPFAQEEFAQLKAIVEKRGCTEARGPGFASDFDDIA
jgi:hypothetical protein